MRIPAKPGNWAEAIVFTSSATQVMAQLNALAEEEQDEVRLAVMTAIALGDRGDLEQAFPDLAIANPEHGDWPFLRQK
ncbi:hypothetical protein NG726_17725 [Pseudomonas sp. MOB-449]|nr:hypothetical protein [Pseudomonas sp. MOB-449]